MTIIVTGGAGFIGSNFIFYYLKEHPEDRVICLDKLTYAGNLSTLAPIMDEPNFRFVKLDICDREGVFALFEEEKPDAVINFAAESHVDRSIENPSIFLQTNIIGTSVLMDACRAFGNVRYHQVSRMRSMVTCRWIGPISSLLRKPPSIPAALTAPPRPGLICWFSPICVHMGCR